MYEIKKIGFFSAIKFGFIAGAVMSVTTIVLIICISFILGGVFIFASLARSFLSLLMYLLVPLIGGVVSGALISFVYNLLAPLIGGIQMDIVLKDESLNQGQPPTQPV